MLPKFNASPEEIEVIRNQFKIIHALKSAIESTDQNKEWDADFKEKVINDFTYHSNKLEGNSLTYGETISFLKTSIVPANRSIGDIIDIKAHAVIMNEIMNQYKNFDLSIDSIKSLHSKLMANKLQWKHQDDFSPGKFKWDTNYTIRPNGQTRQFMSVAVFENVLQEVSNDVQKALLNKNETKLEAHPLYIATYFHQNFMYAHPFADGNGRIGRILSNLILIKENYSPIIINEQEKNNYLDIIDKNIVENNQKQVVTPEILGYFCKKEILALSNKLESIREFQQEKNNNNTLSH